MDHLSYLKFVFVKLSRLLIAALWSHAGKGLTSWLSFVMFNCVFVTFPCGILGQVWYFIVLIPDLCRLSYFYNKTSSLSHISLVTLVYKFKLQRSSFPQGNFADMSYLKEQSKLRPIRYVCTL